MRARRPASRFSMSRHILDSEPGTAGLLLVHAEVHGWADHDGLIDDIDYTLHLGQPFLDIFRRPS